jgi:hypothetical protein
MTPPEKRPVMMITVVALLIAGVVVLCIFRLPWPLRLAVAATDLIAAAILFAASRQHAGR